MNIDAALDFHAQALLLRAQRARWLASNLANADTPNFKARDVNFHSALREAVDRSRAGGRVAMQMTHAGHVAPGVPRDVRLQYRVPTQPAIDGNTVEETLEKSEFIKNAIGYQASLRLLNGRVQGLMSAIRGE